LVELIPKDREKVLIEDKSNDEERKDFENANALKELNINSFRAFIFEKIAVRIFYK
tara:strand:+ start:258 stop:425 length:168 start_codon:yes stop_codon:yes gene_type:complete